MSNQLDIYQQVILDHNRKPRNFFKIPNATHSAEGFNPLCGDHLWVYLVKDENDCVKSSSFEGSGCAISKASASLMTTILKEMPQENVLAVCDDFQRMLKGDLTDQDEIEQRLGKLKVFSTIWQYPSRIRCASLAWHAVKGALTEQCSLISTESLPEAEM